MTRGRVRLRRRLLLISAPVVVVSVLAAIKMISVVVLGGAAVSDFAGRDVGALRDDVSALHLLNVIEPGHTTFADGDLAAAAGDLAGADARFGDVLSQTAAAQSCPVRINLELVRETQGDLAVKNGDPVEGVRRYQAALAVIKGAPERCFQGNDDPDPGRRAIRDEAAARLAEKIRQLEALVAPPPGAPQPGVPSGAPQPAPPSGALQPAPPPGAPAPGSSVNLGVLDPDQLPGGPVAPLRLGPDAGDPLDRLQEALGNSSAAGHNGP